MQPMPAKLQESLRWDDVRIFLGAYRQKSFGLAAGRLGVDTSTVSRRISALERVLGARLFERSRDGLVPTRAAETLLDAAEAMSTAEARFTRELASLEGAAEGVVRVSADPGAAELFVAPSLVRLRQRFPGIDVELDTSTRALDLARHEADIALRTVAPRGAELLVTKLAQERWTIVGSAELVRSLGRPSSWKVLPWIAWDADWVSFPPALWLAKHAKGARIALRTSHIGAQMEAARSGLGLVLLPSSFARARGLVELRPASSLAASVALLPKASVWLAGHRSLRSVPRVAAVWDFLRAELRRDFGASQGATPRPGPRS